MDGSELPASLFGNAAEHANDCDDSRDTMSCSSRKLGLSSQSTKRVGLIGGYLQSMPCPLHLWQRGICLPHRRFAAAQALHACCDMVLTVLMVMVVC